MKLIIEPYGVLQNGGLKKFDDLYLYTDLGSVGLFKSVLMDGYNIGWSYSAGYIKNQGSNHIETRMVRLKFIQTDDGTPTGSEVMYQEVSFYVDASKVDTVAAIAFDATGMNLMGVDAHKIQVTII